MFVICEIVDLAEWIIDDTCLVKFRFLYNKITKSFSFTVLVHESYQFLIKTNNSLRKGNILEAKQGVDKIDDDSAELDQLSDDEELANFKLVYI